MMRSMNRRSIFALAMGVTSAMGMAGILLFAAPPAEAGVFDPSQSFLEIRIGDIPPLLIPTTPLACVSPEDPCAFLVDNGVGGVTVSEADFLWQITSASFPSSYFTGVPMVENLRLVSLTNSFGTFTSAFTTTTNVLGSMTPPLPSTGFGGIAPFLPLGALIIDLTGGLTVSIPLSGVGDFADTFSVFPVSPTVTEGTIGVMPFFTAPVQITGVESPVISLPDRGGVTGVAFTLLPTAGEQVVQLPGTRNTVTISGTNALGGLSEAGFLRVVSPIRINTNGLLDIAIPAAVFQHLVFQAPEPTTMALFGAAIATLAGLGRARMRRK